MNIVELIQKIIFPEGVYYDLEKQSFRTTRVNLVIAPIPQLYSISGGIKDRQEAYYGLLSSQVGPAGFELYMNDLLEVQKLCWIIEKRWRMKSHLRVASRNF
jgi:hypothetical protein